MNTNEVFVSYSKKDWDSVQPLLSGFESHNIGYWIDRTLTGSDVWRSEISKAIKECKIFLMVLTENSNKSKEVRLEVELAQKLGKNILFLQIEKIDVIEDGLDMLVGHYQNIIEIDTPLSDISKKVINDMKKILGTHLASSDESPNTTQKDIKAGIQDLLNLNYEEAYNKFLPLAEKSSDAQFLLGELYILGRYVQKDIAKAKYYFEKAIKNGDDRGYFGLAQILEQKDEFHDKINEYYKKSFEAIFESSINGDIYSTNLLGIMYHDGKGVEKSLEKALRYYREAAMKGYSTAQYNLGYMYDKIKDDSILNDYEEAFKWYNQAAHKGSSLAQNSLGEMYQYGREKVIMIDYLKAAEWYKKAANSNNTAALRNLGILYHGGLGVELDPQKAVDCFQKAFDLGDYQALAWLGLMFELGDGVDKDCKRAQEYYKKTLEHDENNDLALYQLGYMAFNGSINGEIDYTKAINYFKKVSRTNTDNGINAFYYLGFCYENNLGVEKDLKKAFEFYKNGAELNQKSCQFRLGLFYEKGWAVSAVDNKKALYWYTQAAIQGLSDAQLYVGDFYYFQIGVEQDLPEAINWYRKAAIQNNPQAQYILGYICQYEYKDTKNASDWYELAVKNNHGRAKYQLSGLLINLEPERSKTLMIESAESGVADANYEIALIYENEKKYDKAYKCFQFAAEKNFAKAQTKLGWYFQNGIYVQADIKEAILYYQDAINEKQPDYSAYGYLGWIYEFGIGVTKNIDSAYLYYSKGFQNKDFFSTGVCFEKEWLNIKNNGSDLDNYRKAWDKQAHPIAAYKLAIACLYLAKTEEDYNNLQFWLNQAIDKGMIEAKELAKSAKNKF